MLSLLSYTGQCTAADNGQFVIEDNITYGKAGDTELKLDLARPQGDGPFPAIVFIHGGGWYQGQSAGIPGTNPRSSQERLRCGDHQLPADEV